MKRLDIVWIVSGIGTGGAERQISYLAPRLKKNGFTCAVINVSPRVRNSWYLPNIKIYAVNSVNYISRLVEVIYILKKLKPQIVHAWHSHCSLYAGIGGLIAGVPVRLGSLRNDLLFEIETTKKYLITLSYRYLNGLVANSKRAIFNYKLIKYPLPPGLTIWNGIDTNMWYIDEPNQLNKLFNNGNLFIIGVIGRINIQKNPLLFLRAFNSFLKEVTYARAVWVGDGPFKNKLAKQVQSLNLKNEFKMLGDRDNIPELLADMSTITLTSFHEGLPNTLMEASAAAKPCVATDVGGCGEVIEHGVTGLLVHPDDELGLINAWKILAKDQDLCKKMGLAARQRMVSNFSMGRMVENFTSLYDRLLRGDSFFDISIKWDNEI